MSLFLVFTLLPTLQLLDSQRQLPLRQIAATLRQVHQEELIIQAGFKPSLVFYAHKPLTYMYTPEGIQARLKEEWQQSNRPVLLIGLKSRLEVLTSPEQPMQVLQDTGTYQLVRLQKQL